LNRRTLTAALLSIVFLALIFTIIYLVIGNLSGMMNRSADRGVRETIQERIIEPLSESEIIQEAAEILQEEDAPEDIQLQNDDGEEKEESHSLPGKKRK